MKKIPAETAAKGWLEINAQSDQSVIADNLRGLYGRQPLLMTYLTVADKESLNEDERQMLYYLGSFVVRIMMAECPQALEVTEEQWQKARETNLAMLKFLSSENDAQNFRQSMDDVINAHHQSELFRLAVEILMRDPLCRQTIREENAWKLFTHLKIIIDCLDKAASPD